MACSDPDSESAIPGNDVEAFGATACVQASSMRFAELPVPDLVITGSTWRAENFQVVTGRNGETTAVPAHCEIEGYFGEYTGRVGGDYRVAFRIRLPQAWNGRFLFQGGGGSNGYVGDAIGAVGAGDTPALARGYAVLAQDSGHDNTSNNVAEYQGELVFGFDPTARANYVMRASSRATTSAWRPSPSTTAPRRSRDSFAVGHLDRPGRCAGNLRCG